MVGDQLAKFESKVNSSVLGNFSTSQSTHSKQKKKQQSGQYKCIEQRQFQKNSEQAQLQDNKEKHQKVDEQMQNRLFTFMDEKDCQRKVIQNFFFNRTNKHHNLCDQNQENNTQLLNMANAGIQRIIEDSKNKQQKILKNLSNINSVNKQAKSNKKLYNLSKSKTPRNTAKCGHNYLTIEPKDQSKTQKYDSYRSITPKYEKQKRLIRAKSTLDHNFLCFHEIMQKKQKKQSQKISDSKKVSSSNAPLKQLLKKKKQLEKQLIQINSSLLCRKKKNSVINIVTTKKFSNLKTIKHRKKSISKFAQCELKSFKHFLI